MFANVKTVVVLLWLCSCCSAPDTTTVSRRHARTRSGSSQQPRTQSLTAGMPPVNIHTGAAITNGKESTTKITTNKVVTANGSTGMTRKDDIGGSVLRDYLLHKPSNIFRNLMKSGVGVVQRSMDAFEGVSSKVFQVARKKMAEPHSTTTSSEARSNSVGDTKSTAQGQTTVNVNKPKHGLVKGFSKSIVKIINSGIAGMEQITDLGLLLGNIGTHKIRAKLDGQNGNHEILNLLIKYISSRYGKNTQGNANNMIDDISTISIFVSKNDEITRSIATIMEKFMNDSEVSAAMVRVAITVLNSSPSTSCLLDRIPLSPEDIRMAFNVFVGSSGLDMLKTIAGLVSELTTGPDAKEFLESALGMASMLKSDDSTTSDPKNPVSVVGSLTNFFTGGDDEHDDEVDDRPPPTPEVKKKNINSSNDGGNDKKSKPKSPPKKKIQNQEEDDWFSGDTVFNSQKQKISNQPKEEDDWFSGGISNKPKSGLGGRSLKSKTTNGKNEMLVVKTKTNSEKKKSKKRKQSAADSSNSGGHNSSKAFFEEDNESSGNKSHSSE